MSEIKDKPIYCSFCGKSNEDVVRVVQAQGVVICEGCVEQCRDLIGMQRMDDRYGKKDST